MEPIAPTVSAAVSEAARTAPNSAAQPASTTTPTAVVDKENRVGFSAMSDYHLSSIAFAIEATDRGGGKPHEDSWLRPPGWFTELWNLHLSLIETSISVWHIDAGRVRRRSFHCLVPFSAINRV